jgi:hypothetical protein
MAPTVQGLRVPDSRLYYFGALAGKHRDLSFYHAHPHSNNFKEAIVRAFYGAISYKPETTFGNVVNRPGGHRRGSHSGGHLLWRRAALSTRCQLQSHPGERTEMPVSQLSSRSVISTIAPMLTRHTARASPRRLPGSFGRQFGGYICDWSNHDGYGTRG